jgi:hypothetical protein
MNRSWSVEMYWINGKSRAGRMASQMALMVSFLFAGGTAMSYEQPDYTVLYKDGDIEYRQYEPYLVSETLIENKGDSKDAGSEGFRRLFRYITGGNQSQSKISMTAPVSQAPSEKISMTVPVQQAASAEGWRVSFMLPGEYTLDTAPVPSDSRVYIREVPGSLMAVRRFSGRWTEKNYLRYQTELKDSIAGENIQAIGEMQRAAYNAPFSLPFLRRNEVMIAVDRLPAAAETQFESEQLAAY